MKAHTILFLAFFVFCNIFGNVMSGEILNEYKMADPSVSSVAIVDANTINELQFGEVAVLERSIKNTGSTIIEINGVYNMSCGCRGGSKIDKKTQSLGKLLY